MIVALNCFFFVIDDKCRLQLLLTALLARHNIVTEIHCAKLVKVLHELLLQVSDTLMLLVKLGLALFGEEVHFEFERRLFLRDHIAEELRIVAVELSVI